MALMPYALNTPLNLTFEGLNGQIDLLYPHCGEHRTKSRWCAGLQKLLA
jgi:hypothetical protein